MSVIGGAFVRRVVQATRSDIAHDDLLAGLGLSPTVDPKAVATEAVDAESFYETIERATPIDDFALPFRYAALFKLDDGGALGLALKTASTVGEALRRLARYILVLSDTVEYEFRPSEVGTQFVLIRPHHRRGAQIANECALSVVHSLLVQAVGRAVPLEVVSFRHQAPASTAAHVAHFGCRMRFGDRTNGLHMREATLAMPVRLADEGLSAYLLAELDSLMGEVSERSLVDQIHAAVTDALPDGRPRRSDIARRLGMSERTMHRRLADDGETYQAIARRAQQEAAESLLGGRSASLAEVAFLTGFSDQSAFTRAFKEWTGSTPLAFRDAAG